VNIRVWCIPRGQYRSKEQKRFTSHADIHGCFKRSGIAVTEGSRACLAQLSLSWVNFSFPWDSHYQGLSCKCPNNVMNNCKRPGKSSVAVTQSIQPLVSGDQDAVLGIIGMLMGSFLSHNTLAPMVHACKLLQEVLRFKQSHTQFLSTRQL
jgi:hypothetical protein